MLVLGAVASGGFEGIDDALGLGSVSVLLEGGYFPSWICQKWANCALMDFLLAL